MDIQEYISSGVIESYLLGELSDKERSELEAFAAKHPEIKAEIEAVELTLMNFASKTPPAHLKQNILAKLDVKGGKVVSMETKKSSFGWLAAASIALLLGSALYNIILMSRLGNMEEELTMANIEVENYARDFERQSASYTTMAEELAVLRQPENKKVMLKGMDVAPEALATIYWNQKNQEVYINVNSLPPTATDKQYQLWAIVDGEPVDMGMLDMNPELPPLHKMKSVSGAQAFAVTLEQKGGVSAPTLTAMYLMGNV